MARASKHLSVAGIPSGVPAHAIIATPINYPTTLAEIEAKREQYAAITCDTPAEYETCRLAIADCRTTRVAIEERRKELKADSLEYGRRVDSMAKELTALVESLEEPLKAKKLVVDTERDRVKREAEEAEVRAIEEKVRADREAEEARLRAEREAEEARLAVERERLAEEQRKLDAERATVEAAQKAEREAIAAERAKLEADQRAADAAAQHERDALEAQRREADRVEFERQATIRAEAEAKQRAERERVEAEEARVAEAERQAKAQARLEALRPDAEKLAAFATTIENIATPAVSSKEARALLSGCVARMVSVAKDLRGFA